MKKLQNIFKLIASVVCSLLMAIGLLNNGVQEASISSVKKETAAVTNYDSVKNLYKLSYDDSGDGKVTLLLSSNVKAYKNLTKSDLSTIQSDLISILKDAATSDIDLTSTTSASLSKSNQIRLAKIITVLFDDQNNEQSQGSNSSSSTQSSALSQLIASGLSSVEALEALKSGSYNNLIGYYLTNTSTGDATADQAKVNEIVTDIKSVINTVYTEAGKTTEEIAAAQATVSSNITEIKTKVDDTTDNTYETISFTEINSAVTTIKETISNDTQSTETVGSLVGGLFNEMNLSGSDVTEIVKNSDSSEVVDFFTKIDTSDVKEILSKVDIQTTDAKEIVSEIGVNNLVEIANKVGNVEDLKEIVNSIGISKSDLEEIITESVSSITPELILQMITSVRINGNVVASKNTNSEFEVNSTGVKALAKDLPTLSEIANYTDSQMNKNFEIEAVTSFGTFKFNLTIGFFGDCSNIRALARYAAETFDVSKTDGTYNVTIHAPSGIEEFLNNSELSSVLFELSSENINSDNFTNALKSVDYQKVVECLYDAQQLNELFDVERFTDAQLDTLVNGFAKLAAKGSNLTYDKVKDLVTSVVSNNAVSKVLNNSTIENTANKLFNLLKTIDSKNVDPQLIKNFINGNTNFSNEDIYDYIDKGSNLIEKVFNALPESLEDKTLLDYYVANKGEISISTSVNVKTVLNKINPTLGEKLGTYIDVFASSLKNNVNVHLTLDMDQVYKVTLHYDNSNVVSGLLPYDASIMNVTDDTRADVLAWVDASGKVYDYMPDQDIELYAVLAYDVTTENVTKTYDGTAAGLTYTTIPSTLPANVYYVANWYKGTTEVKIEDVKNVADSGTYRVEVSVYTTNGTPDDKTDDYPLGTAKSAEATVTINQKEIEVPTVETTSFVYNKTEQGITIAESTDYTVGGTTKATNVGTYEATVELADAANTKWKTEFDGKVSWSITKAQVTAPTATTGLVYNGQEQTGVAATDDYDVTNGSATNAGTYEATVTLKDADNYEWSDSTFNGKVSYTIAQKEITAPADPEVLSFVYNGSEQGIAYTDTDDYTYGGETKATNVGTYTATVTLKDTTNTKWSTEYAGNISWAITAKEVTAPADPDTTSFVYNGSEQGISVAESTDYTVAGTLKATNVGTYTVTVTLKDTTNTKWADSTYTGTISWVITTKQVVAPANPSTTSFVYNGKEQSITITSGADYTIGGTTKATNVGTYEATVTLKDTANTEWADSTYTGKISWEITVKTVAVPVVNQMNDYTGNPITVITDTEDYKVVSGTATATNPGIYVVKISLVDTTNTAWSDSSFNGEIEWSIIDNSHSYPPVDRKVYDENGQLIAEITNGTLKNYNKFSATNKGSSEKVNWKNVLKSSETIKKNDYTIYDLSIEQYDQNVNGRITIKLLIPEELRGAEDIRIIYVKDGVAQNVIESEISEDGMYITFTTNHFSDYAVAKVSKTIPWWVWLIVAAVIILIIVLIILLTRKKEDKKPVQETPVAEEVAEEVVEETHVVEEIEENTYVEATEATPTYLVAVGDGYETASIKPLAEEDIVSTESSESAAIVDVIETEDNITVKMFKKAKPAAKVIVAVSETDENITVKMFKKAKPVVKVIGKNNGDTVTIYKKPVDAVSDK